MTTVLLVRRKPHAVHRESLRNVVIADVYRDVSGVEPLLSCSYP